MAARLSRLRKFCQAFNGLFPPGTRAPARARVAARGEVFAFLPGKKHGPSNTQLADSITA